MPDKDLPAPSSGCYLGFDFGERRIGVAVGQLRTATASPLQTVTNAHGRPHWQDIDQLVDEWQPVGFVVGIPIYADDSQPALLAARAFSRKLRNRYGLPVYQHDESHSSLEAGRVVAGNRRDAQRRRTRRGDIDKLAAALILGNWLDEHA